MSQFIEKDTLRIQMTSLCDFMGHLSYVFHPAGYFISEEHEARAFQKISFAKAVQLHNAWMMGHERVGLMAHYGWLTFDNGYATVSQLRGFKVPVSNLLIAQASKIVKQVKLQYSRKLDFPIQVQSHLVEFTHPAYVALAGFKED